MTRMVFECDRRGRRPFLVVIDFVVAAVDADSFSRLIIVVILCVVGFIVFVVDMKFCFQTDRRRRCRRFVLVLDRLVLVGTFLCCVLAPPRTSLGEALENPPKRSRP